MLGKSLVTIQSFETQSPTLLSELALHFVELFHDCVIDEPRLGEIDRNSRTEHAVDLGFQRNPIAEDGGATDANHGTSS